MIDTSPQQVRRIFGAMDPEQQKLTRSASVPTGAGARAVVEGKEKHWQQFFDALGSNRLLCWKLTWEDSLLKRRKGREIWPFKLLSILLKLWDRAVWTQFQDLWLSRKAWRTSLRFLALRAHRQSRSLAEKESTQNEQKPQTIYCFFGFQYQKSMTSKNKLNTNTIKHIYSVTAEVWSGMLTALAHHRSIVPGLASVRPRHSSQLARK